MVIVKDISEIEPKRYLSRVLYRRDENLKVARTLHFLMNRGRTCNVRNRKDFHIEKSKLTKLLMEGNSINAIARDTGTTVHLIQSFIEEYDIAHLYCYERWNRKKGIKKPLLEGLIDDLFNYKEISQFTGISISLVYRRVKEYGLTEKYISKTLERVHNNFKRKGLIT